MVELRRAEVEVGQIEPGLAEMAVMRLAEYPCGEVSPPFQAREFLALPPGMFPLEAGESSPTPWKLHQPGPVPLGMLLCGPSHLAHPLGPRPQGV